MKVLITYRELQWFENTIEVEMTKKEYNQYLKKSLFEQEQEFQFMGNTSVENGNWVATEILGIDVDIIQENYKRKKLR
jgi:hypothetical protein